MRTAVSTEVWFAGGVRTPFAKVDGPLAEFDAISLSVPVVRHMTDLLHGGAPDFAAWGTVVPNLTWSNIAREVACFPLGRNVEGRRLPPARRRPLRPRNSHRPL